MREAPNKSKIRRKNYTVCAYWTGVLSCISHFEIWH